jgi:predicted outer membrane protein
MTENLRKGGSMEKLTSKQMIDRHNKTAEIAIALFIKNQTTGDPARCWETAAQMVEFIAERAKETAEAIQAEDDKANGVLK